MGEHLDNTSNLASELYALSYDYILLSATQYISLYVELFYVSDISHSS